jgi:hypothetical protein
VEEPLVDGSQRRRRRRLIDDPQSLGDDRWVTVTKLHWNGQGPGCGEEGLGSWCYALVVMDLHDGGSGWIPPPGISGSGTARVR